MPDPTVDAILDLRARGDATKAIAATLGITGPGIRRIYKIVADARAMHDPRAAYRNGQGLPASPERQAQIERQRQGRIHRKKGRQPGAPLDGWWFAATTVMVTRLGFGSVDCARVPVSVSCVPAVMPIQRPAEGSRARSEAFRSFGEAMAAHPHHAPRQADHAPQQT